MVLTARIRSQVVDTVVPTVAPTVATVAGLRALTGGGSVPMAMLTSVVEGGLFSWSAASSKDDGGLRLNAGGLGSITAGWQRVFSGPLNVKWFGAIGDGVADDSAAIQRAFNAAQLRIQATAAPGTGSYTLETVFFPKGIYKIVTTLEKGSYIGMVGDPQVTLKAATSSTDILRIGTAYNTIEGFTFAGGRRAIVIGGPSAIWNPGGNIDGLGIDAFGGLITRCDFRYQSGPSIAIDASTEHRSGSQTFICKDFAFQGCTLFYGTFDAFFFADGRIIADADTTPVNFDSGARMGVFVNGGGILSVSRVSCAGQGTGDRAWLEGTGIFRTWDFRRGESAFVTYRVRTTGMTYLGEPAPVETNGLAEIYSNEDVFTNTNKNLIEVYDDFPAVISIRNPVPTGLGNPRDYNQFAFEPRVWVDSVSCPASEWQESAKSSLLLDFPAMFPGIRFYTSASPTGAGTDVTSIFLPRLAVPSPQCLDDAPGRLNLWFTGGGGELWVDPSYGSNGSTSGVTLTDDKTLGITARKATANTAADTGFIAYVTASAASVGWGDTPSYSAGLYCYSVYVKANFSGFAGLSADTGLSSANGVAFEASSDWQRIWFPFYHDGSERQMNLAVSNIPGTAGTAGQITFALPMINEGARPAPYVFPGFSIATGGATDDIHRIGRATNYGRTVEGCAIHTSDSGSAQNVGTITLPRNGVYEFVATFFGRKSTGDVFIATRRAKFKRVSGTTTQMGTTESLGADEVETSTSAWLASIDNSTDTIRFRTTSENTATWQVDWKMEARVV